METVNIETLKAGEYFTKKAIPEPRESQVYCSLGYDRSARKYAAVKFTDALGTVYYFKKGTKVYTEFTF